MEVKPISECASPNTPPAPPDDPLMSFPSAFAALLAGKCITRSAWVKPEWDWPYRYCRLCYGILMLCSYGFWFKWIIKEEDQLAQDWSVVPNTNTPGHHTPGRFW